MSKELIIAIIVGIIMGAVVTYGIYTANQAILNKQRAQDPQNTTNPSPTPSVPKELTVEIVEPKNHQVFSKPTITIIGKTLPESVIIILTEDKEHLVNADTEGSFSQPITLISGANTITITASDTSKLSNTQELNLVYSTVIEN